MVKKIFSKKVAYQLISQGFNLIDMEDNLKYKNLKVFIFQETDEFKKALTEITNNMNK